MAAAPASAAEAPSVAVPEVWAIRGRELSLRRPLVMGVVNVTPDSFSDGGRYLDAGVAVARGVELLEEGADLLDVGGESTRPGAEEVPIEEEAARVVPVIVGLRERGITAPISVDTRKAEVARAALAAGADIVNDVSALDDPGMARVVRDAGAGLVLMHMLGTPATMQLDPGYVDVVEEVADHLATALGRAVEAGIDPARVALDPGIGFGKTLEHNLSLLRGLPRLARLGRPVLLGVSRKAFIGRIVGRPDPDDRLAGTVGACVTGYLYGARIFRVHDARPVSDALRVAAAIASPGEAA